MNIRQTVNSGPLWRLFVTVIFSLALSACGGGNGAGDSDSDDSDTDDPPMIGGGDDPDDPLTDDIEDPVLTDFDPVEGGCDIVLISGVAVAGIDIDSSTTGWDDNCAIFVGGTHRNSSYTQGIQRIIFSRGFTAGNSDILNFADGSFGPITQDQVREFQQAEGIAADGFVGPETWGALEDVVTAALISTTESDRNIYGVEEFDGGPAFEGVAQFFQAIDPVTFEEGGWTMAETPGTLIEVPFSIGPPQSVSPADL